MTDQAQTPKEPRREEPRGSSTSSEFSQQARQERQGIVSEFGSFLLNNKKWWLTPIILMLLLFGLLIVLAGTGAAPFIYTLF
jgi:hypothetical protein